MTNPNTMNKCLGQKRDSRGTRDSGVVNERASGTAAGAILVGGPRCTLSQRCAARGRRQIIPATAERNQAETGSSRNVAAWSLVLGVDCG